MNVKLSGRSLHATKLLLASKLIKISPKSCSVEMWEQPKGQPFSVLFKW